MDFNIESLLDKVSDHVKSLASTETVLGEEFTIGEFTCRPVIKVGTGFGSGAGTGKDPKSNKGTGGGAGAGIGITPLGFKVCFEGGYMEESFRKERHIRQTFQKQKREIAFLKKKIRSKNILNTFLLVSLILALTLISLMALELVDLLSFDHGIACDLCGVRVLIGQDK